MNIRKLPDKNAVLQMLPAVDMLLRSAIAGEIQLRNGAKYALSLTRQTLEKMRGEILADDFTVDQAEFSREIFLEKAECLLKDFYNSGQKKRLQKVINATGVIIHTNLGRAPLSENARKAIFEIASGYCNLEYDLETGKRGRRGGRTEKMLADLTGAEDALIVNNCAAAAFLVLTVLAKGGEAVVSRGELVEIGGDFRVPDVMTQSGATLREVGTTNRTKLADYENAVNENTKLICKIHPSNFRVVGFTKSVGIAELSELAHEKNIVLYEDAGSGAIFDLSEYGLNDEPIISQSIKNGADVVTFSGDKLLGGVQSGLITGRREIIERLRKHPLYRALRVDKLIYAALEATLESFLRENAVTEIPVLKMLSQTREQLKRRIENFAAHLSESSYLTYEIISGNSVVGGGSAPGAQPSTELLGIKHSQLTTEKFEEKLRFSKPPVIARIWENRVLIDLRTVSETEESEILKILSKL